MTIEKPNIFLYDTGVSLEYKGHGRGKTNYPERDVKEHGRNVLKMLKDCRREAALEKLSGTKRVRQGTYLEFSGQAKYELATNSLEDRRKGIRLLNVKTSGNKVVQAAVYVPQGKENYFVQKAEQYIGEKTKYGKPKNKNLIGSIEAVRLSCWQDFWTDTMDRLPGENAVWCEVWLRYEFEGKDYDSRESAEENFVSVCQENGILVGSGSLYFPERIVKKVFVTANDIDRLVACRDDIAEVRATHEPNTFYKSLRNDEQAEWIEDLRKRVKYVDRGSYICLLDTGVSNQHRLICDSLAEKDVQAVEPNWNTRALDSHGTEMAGVALYFDLNDKVSSLAPVEIHHRLESVKILPDKGKNPPELYGTITARAIALAEIANPNVNRTVCMAITEPGVEIKGEATSWSAALDKIAVGAEEEDVKRLLVVSAGNVGLEDITNNRYPQTNYEHSIQSPAQAWNVLTVGAFAGPQKIESKGFTGFKALAKPMELCPFSTTSVSWAHSGKLSGPIKPEVVFDGGNAAVNDSGDCDYCEDLELLTTGCRPLSNGFTTINATSAATAQAAYFAAELRAQYPNAWPETIRALMIHSARWSKPMLDQCRSGNLGILDKQKLLRSFGYGTPVLDKAVQCAGNCVNLIIEDTLRPFKTGEGKRKSTVSMGGLRFYELPWPQKILRDLGETSAVLRVTLSYFIEPGPGAFGDGQRYKYESYGLRFELVNAGESKEEFKRRISVSNTNEAGDNETDGTMNGESGRWQIGKRTRNKGSIHSDFIEKTAAELSDCRYVAVYPVGGWWKERKNLNRFNGIVRFALIVSIETPETKADLYTTIVNQVQNSIKLSVRY